MKNLVLALSFVLSATSFAQVNKAEISTKDFIQQIRVSIALVTSAPFVSSLVSSLPEDSKLAKEQLAEVRSDAVDFIADSENASEALLKSIEAIRERLPQLKESSDKEIAGLIITALQ